MLYDFFGRGAGIKEKLEKKQRNKYTERNKVKLRRLERERCRQTTTEKKRDRLREKEGAR